MLNLVVLIGNLGADPEIRTTPSGIKVAKMRLAVNDIWTNRTSGEKEKRTHWVDLNAWDRQAQTAERFLTRGQRIAVRGSLEYREWTGQDGVKRSKLEVRVREMVMLSPKDSSGSASNWNRQANNSDNYDDSGSRQTKKPESKSPQRSSEDDYDVNESSSDYSDAELPVEDDDIPF
jgi:single-strand DNA-binding protein